VITPTSSPNITQIIINPCITVVKDIKQQMLFSILDLNYAFIIVWPMHSFFGLVIQDVLVALLLQQDSAPQWRHYSESFDHHYWLDTTVVFVINMCIRTTETMIGQFVLSSNVTGTGNCGYCWLP